MVFGKKSEGMWWLSFHNDRDTGLLIATSPQSPNLVVKAANAADLLTKFATVIEGLSGAPSETARRVAVPLDLLLMLSQAHADAKLPGLSDPAVVAILKELEANANGEAMADLSFKVPARFRRRLKVEATVRGLTMVTVLRQAFAIWLAYWGNTLPDDLA